MATAFKRATERSVAYLSFILIMNAYFLHTFFMITGHSFRITGGRVHFRGCPLSTLAFGFHDSWDWSRCLSIVRGDSPNVMGVPIPTCIKNIDYTCVMNYSRLKRLCTHLRPTNPEAVKWIRSK